jgi:hypothetical protein
MKLCSSIMISLDLTGEISYIRHLLRLVVGGGFEPPKASPTDLQSVPFGHSGTPPCFIQAQNLPDGASEGTRTPDPLITNQ